MLEINQIYNADCVTGIQSIKEDAVDFTLTSPPYGNLRTYGGYNAPIDYDSLIPDLYRVTKPGGVVVWIVADQTKNGSESGDSFRQALQFMASGFLLHDTMIWKKNSHFTCNTRYIPAFEYMFIFSKGKPKTVHLIQDRKNVWAGQKVHGWQRNSDGSKIKLSGARQGRTIKEYGARFNVWDIPPEKKNKSIHPAVFPLTLAKDHILSWSRPGDLVFDPFMGSGTTAAAAVETGRDFLGFEINPEYYAESMARVQRELQQYNKIAIGE